MQIRLLIISLYMAFRAALCPFLAYSQATISDSLNTYDMWVTRSFDYIENDSINQAAECLKQAMRLEPANPQNGMLFCNLGTLQRQLGQLTEAEISYSCAIALMPNLPSPRNSRAQLYAQQERYLEAIDDYSAILNLDANNEEALYERGLCRLMSHDTLGARQDMERIDRFNPKSAKSRLGMAIIYKASGQHSMAIDIYNVLIEANPNSWSLLRDRAEVHYLSGRMGAALIDINKSIEKHGQDPMSYLLRAQIRYAKGDKEYARRDLNTAIEKGLPAEVAADLLQKTR